MRNLHYIGDDSMNRQVYRDDTGQLWKDASYGCGEPYIYSVPDFDAEPGAMIDGEFKLII